MTVKYLKLLKINYYNKPKKKKKLNNLIQHRQ